MVSLVINGVSFSYPQTGDNNWGDASSQWAAAVTSGMLQKAGGNFTLTADVNFGPNYGILSSFFSTRTASPSTAGVVRFANNEGIGWRNAAASANLVLKVNSSNQLEYNGAVILTSASLTNNRALISNGSGQITSSSVTDTELGYVSGVTSAIQTQLNTKITASSTDTLTNKKLTDNSVTFVDNGDATKQLAFECSGITTATTRTWTVPDASDTLVGLAVAQTLTNKKLNGISVAYQLSSANVTAVTSDTVIRVDASGGTRTVDLFTAIGNAGKILVFQKTDSSFNIVGIDPFGTETIGGSLTTGLNTIGETLTAISDGANWIILSRTFNQTPVSYTTTASAGWGTLAAQALFWSRTGQYITIWGTLTAGTVTGGAMNLTLPSSLSHGYSADTVAQGTAVSSYSGGFEMPVLLTAAAPGVMNFTKNNAASGMTPIVGNANMVNGSIVSINVSFKISGWNG